MTDHEHNIDQGGVRERLGDVVHAVQEVVTDRVEGVADRVAPITDRMDHAVDAVTSALHEAGHAVTHRGERHPTPDAGTSHEFALVPSGTQIVRPTKGGTQFLAWREGQWSPVHREQGTGWVWSA